MKSMILSMLTAIALSNPDTNVIHENMPRLIKNNREILSVSECPTLFDKCQPSADGKTFEKYYCSGSELVRKQYSDTPCNGNNKINVWRESENPCCEFRCSLETIEIIGICIPTGEEPLSPDPNETEMVESFSFKYCNLDGSGGFRSFRYGCGAEGDVVRSSIMYPDPCCPQPSCDAADFDKCIYDEGTGRSEKYYCGSDGELILSTWEGTDCSDPTQTAWSRSVYDLSNVFIQGFVEHFEIDLSCCSPAPSCPVELDTCVYNEESGNSNKYECSDGNDKLYLVSYDGNDCNDNSNIVSVDTQDEEVSLLCCSK